MPRYIITIDAEYGSPFQDKVAEKSLEVQIKTWCEFLRSTHKGNKVEFTLKKER